jgi:hypothetical protein
LGRLAFNLIYALAWLVLEILSDGGVDESFVIYWLPGDNCFIVLRDESILKLNAQCAVGCCITRQHDDAGCVAVESMDDSGTGIGLCSAGYEAVGLLWANSRDREHWDWLAEDNEPFIGMQDLREAGRGGGMCALSAHIAFAGYRSRLTMKRCVLIITIALCVLLLGCETPRIEYRKRPSWVRLMGGELPSSTMTADGTEIRWLDDGTSDLQGFEQAIGQEKVQIRTDHEDGTVALRSMIPMHLVVNLHECLRRSEYKVIWEQLISQPQRAWYEDRGERGYEDFLTYFQRNRTPIASMLNRMQAGKVYGDVVSDVGEQYGTISLRPQVAYDFPLSSLRIVREGSDWKLENIQ